MRKINNVRQVNHWVNDNFLTRRQKERYNSFPEYVRNKLKDFNKLTAKEYQLQVIKRKRIYPEIGDVFIVRPRENIEYKGIVVNNHLAKVWSGEELILIFIFKAGVDVEKVAKEGVKREDLLISPSIVPKLYWTRGYFFNIGHTEINEKRYGFYKAHFDFAERKCIDKFVDEYGNYLNDEPYLLGRFAVTTDIGIANEINREMIINGII